MVDHAKDYFVRELGEDLILGQKITWKGDLGSTFQDWSGEFDFFIDTTYGGLHQFENVTYEATFLAKFRSDHLPFDALTLVDGPLFSIYPTAEKGTFSLSHVRHSILGQFASQSALDAFLSENLEDKIENSLACMKNHLERYIGDFSLMSSPLEPLFVQQKLKPKGLTDNRQVIFAAEENYAALLGGKVDAIFEGYAQVSKWLEIQ